MEFRVLGPLEVRHGDQVIDLTAPKHRVLLAVLLLHANQAVSVDRLIDYLWGDKAPATAATLVKLYVSQVRKLLRSIDDGAGEVLLTRSGGYLLRLGPDQLDLQVFERLVAEADAAMATGQVERGAAGLHEALELWRGPALPNVASELLHQIDVARLEERRMAAVETRVEAELLLGRHRQLVGELEGLVAAHPLREQLRVQLMTALYRSGRRAEALAVYRQGRRVLIDELGLDPGEQLQALHQAILDGDRALDPGPAPERPPAPAPPAHAPAAGNGDHAARAGAPSQLPPDIGDFTGRSEACARLEQMVTAALEGRASAVAVSAVAGKAGVGKTTVAVHVAHRLRHRFPDGQLYVNLRGAEAQALDPAEVLGEFLRGLGVEGAVVPDELDERARLYRTRLADRRVLVVLDNAAGEAQVRPLLPGSPGCAALITSRLRLAGLESAQRLVLDVFEPAQALELLGRLVGPERVQAEPEAASAICRFCGHLPLAVRIAGAKLASKPHWTLADYARRLRAEHRRLGELVAGDLELRPSVALSYHGLEEPERRALRLLGLLNAPDFAAWVLVPLLDTTVEDAEDIVERLADAQLVEVAGRDMTGRLRYRFHDLLRVFARERLRDEEPEAERSAALQRLLDAYVGLAARADACVGPGRRGRGPLEPPPRWHPDDLGVGEQLGQDPHRWLESERASLVAAVTQAHEVKALETTWALASAMGRFLELDGHWDDWERVAGLAVAAARQAANLAEEAWALVCLGDLATYRWRVDADTYLKQAVKLFERLGDRLGEGYGLRGLGEFHADHARYDLARAAFERCLALFRQLGNQYGEAQTLLSFSEMLDLHRPQEATRYLDQCLPIFRALGDRHGEADALASQGRALYNQGRLQEALDSFRRAVALYHEIDNAVFAAHAQRGIGLVLRQLGRREEASRFLRQTLAVARKFGERRLETMTLHSLAEVCRDEGRFDEARGLYEQCLPLLHEFDDRIGVAHTYYGLGHTALATGRTDEATALFKDALATFREVDVHRGEALTLLDLGDLYRRLGRWSDAAGCYEQAIPLFEELQHRSGGESARDRLAALRREHPADA
jgi:DNA-binding SARP family transcriptional activator/Flp pilus assembly protein TadD